jgi:dTMP kinase
VQSIYTDKKVHYIREPGSTPIAEGIRHISQGTVHTEEMHPLTHAYLYAAARAQTLHTVVYPLLAQGDIVVSDRSYISSLAYQGYAQGLGIDTVYGLNTYALGDILPDILLHIDTPIDIALPRTYDQAGDTWESM